MRGTWCGDGIGALGGAGIWIHGLFEALVIDWLKEASISAVSRLMGLSWAVGEAEPTDWIIDRPTVP